MKSETKTSSSDPNRMAINKQSRANRGTRARGVGRIRAILLTVAAVLLVPLWIRDAVAEGADGSLEHAIAAQQARIEASPEDALPREPLRSRQGLLGVVT